MAFLSPRTHTYINQPTKWGYLFDLTTQASGITFLTLPPNQVGLHLNTTTKLSGIGHDLKSLDMTKYDNYYIIGIYMTFTSNDIIIFKDQKTLKIT